METLPLEFAGYKPGLQLGGIVVEYESTMVSRDLLWVWWAFLFPSLLVSFCSPPLVPEFELPFPSFYHTSSFTSLLSLLCLSSSSLSPLSLSLSPPPSLSLSPPPSPSPPSLTPAHQVHGRNRARGDLVLQSQSQDSSGEDYQCLQPDTTAQSTPYRSVMPPVPSQPGVQDRH